MAAAGSDVEPAGDAGVAGNEAVGGEARWHAFRQAVFAERVSGDWKLTENPLSELLDALVDPSFPEVPVSFLGGSLDPLV